VSGSADNAWRAIALARFNPIPVATKATSQRSVRMRKPLSPLRFSGMRFLSRRLSAETSRENA